MVRVLTLGWVAGRGIACLAASEEQKIPLALPSFMKQPRLGTVDPACRARFRLFLPGPNQYELVYQAITGL